MDDADNPLTKSYLGLVYDYLPLLFAAQSPRHADPPVPFTSAAAFGNASRSLVFAMFITGRFPGLLTWLYAHFNRPGMQKLRQNREEARATARRLLDSKRQELKNGVPRKDIMSLLGSLLPFFLFYLRDRWEPLPSQGQCFTT